ncbi:hypothetical protein N7533_013389 [Penicillium manginii]|uniref:uncharacterized protein n=1 Tax=Penicillium manginii TaxID=203109 RepID=UPI002547F948|nr:uncharacterized protein N7533_013389 [Penicillium manginii]KAJ5732942.1 hypothetical protein N7533_013389 [Penicillium manginii]
MSGGPGFNFNSQPDLVASNAAAIAQEVGCGIRKYMESLDCLRDYGAWYVMPTTTTDEEVLGSFGLWLHKLSEPTREKLLHLYPLEDCEHMIIQSTWDISHHSTTELHS